MAQSEIIRLASLCVDIAKKLEIDKDFRTRARQFPEIIVYQGLPLAMAYLLAKSTGEGIAGVEVVKELYKLLFNNLPDKSVDEVVKLIKSKYSEWRNEGKKLDADALSHAFYAASLMLMMSKMYNGKKIENLDYFLTSLDTRGFTVFNKVVQRIAYDAARWLKFFAEAKIEKER